MTVPPSDGWDAGSTYEEFMGRWSRPLARKFISWLDAPVAGHWLDVGTGTGAVVEVPTAFSGFDDYWRPFLGGTDPAPSFVATLSEEQKEALSADLRASLPERDDGSIALMREPGRSPDVELDR